MKIVQHLPVSIRKACYNNIIRAFTDAWNSHWRAHVEYKYMLSELFELFSVMPRPWIKHHFNSLKTVGIFEKAGGHIGRNVGEITITMKTIVRKPLKMKIIMLHFNNVSADMISRFLRVFVELGNRIRNAISHAFGILFLSSANTRRRPEDITIKMKTIVRKPLMIGGCPRGVMVKAIDYGIVISEFVLQLRYYVHFRANTLGKCMNLLILPAMG